MEDEIINEDETHFIDQVALIDKEIAEIEKRIVDMKANETALISALRASKIAEHRCTSAYANSPNERSQLALENARDFVMAGQKRVDLFHSNEGVLSGDISMLWQQRKDIISELSRFRCNKIRPRLELEAETLIKKIDVRATRYLTLIALLDGQDVLRLDLDKLLICYDQHHKQNLVDAFTELTKSFEELTKVEL